MEISTNQLADWLDRYFRAWESNDPSEVSALFAEDAIYFYGPYREPARGRETIVANWISDPDGQMDVSWNSEALATNDDLGVAHWNVRFRTRSQPEKTFELDGILVLRFNSSMQCVEHREWFLKRELS